MTQDYNGEFPPFQYRFMEGGYRRKERHEIRTVTPGGIGELVALVRTNNFSGDRATAEFLIRAANSYPNLLETLKAAEALAKKAQLDGIGFDETAEFLDLARAAIAKAEGR